MTNLSINKDLYEYKGLPKTKEELEELILYAQHYIQNGFTFVKELPKCIGCGKECNDLFQSFCDSCNSIGDPYATR